MGQHWSAAFPRGPRWHSAFVGSPSPESVDNAIIIIVSWARHPKCARSFRTHAPEKASVSRFLLRRTVPSVRAFRQVAGSHELVPTSRRLFSAAKLTTDPSSAHSGQTCISARAEFPFNAFYFNPPRSLLERVGRGLVHRTRDRHLQAFFYHLVQ